MNRQILNSSHFSVERGIIVRTRELSPHDKLFEIALPEGKRLHHDPGQFVEVSVFGAGEAPISVCSSPTQGDTFDLCIRDVGRVTHTIHTLKEGDTLGVRGPFGRGFPVRLFEGNDLVLIAGGLGIVPLRSLVQYVISNRRDFGKVSILLGCKTPEDMLFGDEIEQWNKRIDVHFVCTVDKADPEWCGHVGVITSLIPGEMLVAERTFAVIVGPPVMYKYVIGELLKKHIPDRQIIVSLERHMKCGMGRCGHCQIENLYCCCDGPVFHYDEIKHIEEAI
ncbi:FAD/NAD(P)-binding protein [Candidatus Magnetominusculus dajiuhuensis]|uniref:FAD/NAD(P)-binding protein n=1 Tax=Candidatus Magnetominusculus dajiuhuensis TaxID=3137712 RepID=UPI003B42F8DD